MSGSTAATWTFEAIGTRWQIATADELDDAARAAVDAVIDRFDLEWSRFRADSSVRALAAGAGSVPLPADADAMLDTYVELSQATGGAIDPLIGDGLAQRGYDADYSFTDRGPRPTASDWRARLSWQGDALRLSGTATLDVGAIGKGRLVDLVLAELRARVRGPLVVDAGGDIAVHDAAERIGLEHPYDARRAIGVWELADGALCASATNRRSWGDGLHHVLDARTGEPVRTVAATWAHAPTGMTADAAATALFFDGGAQLCHDWGVQWVRMLTDGRVEWSPGCGARLFLRR